MKKFFCLFLVFTLLSASLVSCSGYNKIMRDHLKNKDNYRTCEVYLKDFYYIDPLSDEKKQDFIDQTSLDTSVILEVSFFNSIEELEPFLGRSPNENIPLEEYTFQFCVTKDNVNILLSNGFFNDITIGEKLSVKVSDYIYMDTKFFYVAQLEYNGKEYLSFENGLENIVNMMNENRSLF